MRKKLVQINTVCNGSIGRIMKEIQKRAQLEGYETISFVGRRKVYEDFRCERFGNGVSFWSHVVINTVFDKQGHGSYFATRKLIRRLREEKPDIIHLHNLHGYYLYIPALMKYLKEEFTGQLFWTFHDCWPFTGHCPYFTMVQCDKWKKECYNCPNKGRYPISWFRDASRSNYYEKKDWFTGLNNLTIIVPSRWMEGLVKQSFLGAYPVKVVPNGIDLNVFRREESGQIRKKYGIPQDKKILLGVADIWSERKGLDDFLKLGGVLPKEYVIVLVGMSRRQIRSLPEGIVGILHTENLQELVKLYSEAFIFVNPSREESFSLVTIEAMACGAPVIVLDTSAVGELVSEGCGIVLRKHEPQDYLEAVRKIELSGINRERIVRRAAEYTAEDTGKKAVELYEQFFVGRRKI